MAEQYKVAKTALAEAGIEAKEGVNLSVNLGEGKVIPVTITEVEEETVVVTAKETTTSPTVS